MQVGPADVMTSTKWWVLTAEGCGKWRCYIDNLLSLALICSINAQCPMVEHQAKNEKEKWFRSSEKLSMSNCTIFFMEIVPIEAFYVLILCWVLTLLTSSVNTTWRLETATTPIYLPSHLLAWVSPAWRRQIRFQLRRTFVNISQLSHLPDASRFMPQ